jgi:methionyl aminopeptidase
MANDNVIILKTAEQIDGIRRSCQTAVGVLKRVKDYVIEGIKTHELNDIIDTLMRRQGATPATLNYKGFPASCCISVNDGVCHGVPSNRVLLAGDVVKIDVTTILDGYYGDTCYTWVIGKPSPEAARIVSAARQCLWAGVRAVGPGKSLGGISHAVRIMADKLRCSVVHQFCGHGVGLRFHEPPTVPYDIKKGDWGPVLKPGMTFTIEPMVNLGVAEAVIDAADGWSAYTADKNLSAQFEHTVLVCETGCEVLTDWGDEKTLLPELKTPEALWR